MKILHVVQGYTPAIGGTELLIQQLSERLVARYGDAVTVFTTTAAKNCSAFWSPAEPTLPAGTERINGVTVRRFAIYNRFGHVRHQLSRFADWAKLPFRDWGRALFNGPIVFGMTREIRRFKADVICASSFPFLHMYYALEGSKQSGAPVVFIGALHPSDIKGFNRTVIFNAIREADAYVAYTRFEQAYLRSRNVSETKITTIGAGVDLNQFAGRDGSELRQKFGWGNKPVVAFIGQFTRRKGLPLLLLAMQSVWVRYPDARLLVAGASGSYSGELAQEAAKLTATDPTRIAVISDFSEDDKAKIFSACDVCVLPSVEESFGIVFLEAWACKKPVIGLRVGAIPSVIQEEVDGLLVTPGDSDALARAICGLLERPEWRTVLGQAGYRKVVEHYTWDIVAAKFRELYSQILATNQQRRTGVQKIPES